MIKKLKKILEKKTLTFDEHIEACDLIMKIQDAIDAIEVEEKEIKED